MRIASLIFVVLAVITLTISGAVAWPSKRFYPSDSRCLGTMARGKRGASRNGASWAGTAEYWMYNSNAGSCNKYYGKMRSDAFDSLSKCEAECLNVYHMQ